LKKKELGALGEKAARAFLEKRGYKVLETNFRSREGEIDLIALHHRPNLHCLLGGGGQGQPQRHAAVQLAGRTRLLEELGRPHPVRGAVHPVPQGQPGDQARRPLTSLAGSFRTSRASRGENGSGRAKPG